MKVRNRQIAILAASSFLVFFVVAAGSAQGQTSSWEERSAQHYSVWGRLSARTLVNFADPASTQALSRLDGARYVLENEPTSEYADDAALLAASLQWDIQFKKTVGDEKGHHLIVGENRIDITVPADLPSSPGVQR